MAADDSPRETLLRNMRYERIGHTLSYREVHGAIASYLASPNRDLRILAAHRELLQQELEQARYSQRRENLARQLRALDDFERGLNALGIAGMQLSRPGHYARPILIEGVTVSIQPTVLVRQARPRGADLVGAMIVDPAKGPSCTTDEARAKVTRAMIHSAVLLHMLVTGRGNEDGSCRASASHCIVFHAHRAQAVCAPENHRTMLRNIQAVCRSIARAWPTIQPPAGFDPTLATRRA